VSGEKENQDEKTSEKRSGGRRVDMEMGNTRMNRLVVNFRKVPSASHWLPELFHSQPIASSNADRTLERQKGRLLWKMGRNLAVIVTNPRPVAEWHPGIEGEMFNINCSSPRLWFFGWPL
jgi:hypothetical protein